MPKPLSHIIAFLLVPCLSADPSSTAALTHQKVLSAEAVFNEGSSNSTLRQQALAEPLLCSSVIARMLLVGRRIKFTWVHHLKGLGGFPALQWEPIQPLVDEFGNVYSFPGLIPKIPQWLSEIKVVFMENVGGHQGKRSAAPQITKGDTDVHRNWRDLAVEYAPLESQNDIRARAELLQRLDQEFGKNPPSVTDAQRAIGYSSEVESLFLKRDLWCPEDSRVTWLLEDPSTSKGFLLLLEKMEEDPKAFRQILEAEADLLKDPDWETNESVFVIGPYWRSDSKLSLTQKILMTLNVMAGDISDLSPRRDYIRLLREIAIMNTQERAQLRNEIETLREKRNRRVLWLLLHQLPGVKSLSAYRGVTIKGLYGTEHVRLEDPTYFALLPETVRQYDTDRISGSKGDVVKVEVPLEKILDFDLTTHAKRDQEHPEITIEEGTYLRLDLAGEGINLKRLLEIAPRAMSPFRTRTKSSFSPFDRPEVPALQNPYEKIPLDGPADIERFMSQLNPALQYMVSLFNRLSTPWQYPEYCNGASDVIAWLFKQHFTSMLKVRRMGGQRFERSHHWIEVTLMGETYFLSVTEGQFFYQGDAELQRLHKDYSDEFAAQYNERGYARIVFVKMTPDFYAIHHITLPKEVSDDDIYVYLLKLKEVVAGEIPEHFRHAGLLSDPFFSHIRDAVKHPLQILAATNPMRLEQVQQSA